MCATDPDGLGALVRETKAKDPDKHRGIVLSLVAKKGQRTASLRQKMVCFVQELCAETIVRTKRSALMLTQRQYVSWYVHNEDMSRAEALQKWDQDTINPDIAKEMVGDTLTLAVRMPKEIAGMEQTRKTKRLKTSTDVASGEEQTQALSQLQQHASVHESVFDSAGNAALRVGAASHGGSSTKEAESRPAAAMALDDLFSDNFANIRAVQGNASSLAAKAVRHEPTPLACAPIASPPSIVGGSARTILYTHCLYCLALTFVLRCSALLP